MAYSSSAKIVRTFLQSVAQDLSVAGTANVNFQSGIRFRVYTFLRCNLTKESCKEDAKIKTFLDQLLLSGVLCFFLSHDNNVAITDNCPDCNVINAVNVLASLFKAFRLCGDRRYNLLTSEQ